MESKFISKLNDNFKLICLEEKPIFINANLLEEIEQIWQAEFVRTEGRIFNGKLLSAIRFDGQTLFGQFVDYKLYLAQARNPLLAHQLQIKPICVCAYTTAGPYILMGKRAAHVTDYQNFYELVPAGGIDPSSKEEGSINIIKQLKKELQEEAGIEDHHIEQITPHSLAFFSETDTYELLCEVKVKAAVRYENLGHDDEYTELFWIHKNEMPTFLNKEKDRILPFSKDILKIFLD
jgi:8-oxo-dGTP pyrophosphatase MutT (NUDIX family)